MTRKAFRLAAVLSLAAAALAQTPPPAAPPQDGIPVTNKLVVDKCGGCHKADAKGNLTRISWMRTTPEGWELATKRMIRLNGVTLTPAEARERGMGSAGQDAHRVFSADRDGHVS